MIHYANNSVTDIKATHKNKSFRIKEMKSFLCSHTQPFLELLVTQSRPTLCSPMDCSLHQAPLSMGFPRQECWSELPFPSPGDLPDPGIEPTSPALAGRFFYCSATREALGISRTYLISKQSHKQSTGLSPTNLPTLTLGLKN